MRFALIRVRWSIFIVGRALATVAAARRTPTRAKVAAASPGTIRAVAISASFAGLASRLLSMKRSPVDNGGVRPPFTASKQATSRPRPLVRFFTRESQRGLLVAEIVVALGISTLILLGLLVTFRQTAAIVTRTNAKHSAYRDVVNLVDTFERDAGTAFAAFVPITDVNGNANADGHEVDFFARAASGAASFWAYRYDSGTKTVVRWTYSAPGGAATATGPSVGSISAFTARVVPASSLAADAQTGPLLGGYAPRDAAVRLGYAGVNGGNALIDVTVTGAGVTRTARILAAAPPSGFTVATAATPVPGSVTPAGNTVAIEHDCSKPDGYDRTDSGTTPPTDYFNARGSTCPWLAIGPDTYAWRYDAAPAGCTYDMAAAPSGTCSVTATLLHSGDGGFAWSAVDCTATGSFDTSGTRSVYAFTGTACVAQSRRPSLFGDPGDPRSSA